MVSDKKLDKIYEIISSDKKVTVESHQHEIKTIVFMSGLRVSIHHFMDKYYVSLNFDTFYYMDMNNPKAMRIITLLKVLLKPDLDDSKGKSKGSDKKSLTEPFRGASITVYTDGGCVNGHGGWASYILNDKNGSSVCFSGYSPETTNNRMELQAAISALTYIKKNNIENCRIKLYSDSQYVIKGITTWIDEWKRYNWVRSSKGGEVKNLDYWKILDKLNSSMNVEWEWVKGHSGNEGNEKVDKMASVAINRKRGVSPQGELIL